MNEAPPEKPRRRALGRMAAATAAALGATLLAYPGGTATAQTIDCTTLGDNPRKSGIGAALDAAIACDVEVRVSARAWDQMTVYATPAGKLHLVATAEAVQEYLDYGPSDPTLELFAGTLAQTNSQWWAHLRYDDPEVPLFETLVGTLDWAGDIPVPTFGGTTAIYDDLAPGLDLTADIGSATVGFRFIAADFEAWNALATGLRTDAGRVEAVDGSLRIDDTDSKPDTEWTTPFTVRDADGATYRTDLALTEDGALTVSLPDGALAEAAFPLSLSTQWADRSYKSNEWGAVTSAAADSTLYRGGAGLDEPYFVAAGQSADAVSGAYCDALAGTECTEEQAVAYWDFEWPMLDGLDPHPNYAFDYPVASAVFSVNAAEGANCSAPGLNLTEEYSAATTWNDRPAVVRFAGLGACENGTAIYDLTDAIGSAWGDTAAAKSITFGTVEGAETARFDGGSARLDVYFDIVGFLYVGPHYSICDDTLSTAPFFKTATPVYGDTLVRTWRSEVLDLGLRWTATFTDATTGAAVLTTDPQEVPLGSSPSFTLAEPLPDGKYRVAYDFTSGSTNFFYQSAPCYLVVDTAAPEFLDVTVESGQRYVGDTIGVDVSVTDMGFPDGLNALTVACSVHPCSEGATVLTEGGDAEFEYKIEATSGWLALYLHDKAGNFAERAHVDLPATHSRNDFDGDRSQDLVTVRRSDGALLFHAGRGDSTYAEAVVLATGWGHMEVTLAGDLTSDGFPDLLARDNRNGDLYTYPGDGDGGIGTRIKSGSGWNSMRLFTTGEFDSLGGLDLMAVRKSDGALITYRGNGDGSFGTASVRSVQWEGTADMLVNVGNLVGSNVDEFMVRDARTGEYRIYNEYGVGQYHVLADLADLEASSFNTRVFSQVVNAGDIDGDNYVDLVAVDEVTGELVRESLYYDYGLRAVTLDEVAGSGWEQIRLPSVRFDDTYDYNGDGKTDVFARRGSDGKLYFYSGDGSGGFGPIGTWGTGLKTMSVIETAGDFNGDGFADLIGRVASNGELYLYPGDGQGGHGARIRIGTGWNSMSAIMSGHDYNSDGTIDILAREKSTGYLWLYQGRGDGTIGSRVKIGSGWNSMREITAAGDLNHDGHADVFAIRGSDNCMYFYAGRGDGTIRPAVQVGCHWVGYDSVAAVGDFNGDGHADWVARRQSDGAVYLYKGNGVGGYGSRTQIQTNWTWANTIA